MYPSAVDMQRKLSFLDSFQQQVYRAATQAPHSTLDACVCWSLIRLYRLFALCKALWTRQNALQRAMAHGPPVSDDQPLDKALAFERGRLLFEAELDLSTDPAMSSEYASLCRPGGDIKLDEVSRRLWYKCCYEPSKMQGQSAMNHFTHMMETISAAHTGCRGLIDLAGETVTWREDCDIFAAMARDLQIASSRHAGSQGSNATRGKHWDALGFQGEDPSTDFRATGKLGLRHVSHFCQAHPIYATRMIKESGTAAVTIEGPWYPFALCAIHITALLLTVVKLGSMQRHWLQAAARDPVDGVAALSDKLFSYLFVRCHLDWCEGVDKKEITSILEFEVFFADFAAYIQRDLQTRHRENDDFHVAALKWW